MKDTYLWTENVYFFFFLAAVQQTVHGSGNTAKLQILFRASNSTKEILIKNSFWEKISTK